MILAAGLSSRMEENKMLLKLEEKTIIEHTLTKAVKANVDRVTVVLGNMREQLTEVLRPYQVSIVENPDYAGGMGTSLGKGIGGFINRSDIDAVIIMLGDMPFVQTATINRLVAVYARTGSEIVAPVYQGQRGNPVLLDKRLFPLLLELAGDQGAREIIKQFSALVFLVAVDDPGVLLDIDTRDDWRKVAGEMSQATENG